MDLPTVAIVGRPNVGKSTLFNRLVGRKLALVDDRPGVTRDRREGEGFIGDVAFRVIDTAGLEEADADSLLGRMRAQTEAAIDPVDLPAGSKSAWCSAATRRGNTWMPPVSSTKSW